MKSILGPQQKIQQNHLQTGELPPWKLQNYFRYSLNIFHFNQLPHNSVINKGTYINSCQQNVIISAVHNLITANSSIDLISVYLQQLLIIMDREIEDEIASMPAEKVAE